MQLRRIVGSLLVVGLESTTLTPVERAWLRVIAPGGIILFRRNIADPQQTHALLAEATSLCSAEAFRCVDLEGGLVDRLREALAPMPSAQAVAAAMRSSGKRQLATQHGELIARAVTAFGLNTTLAPVLDLGLPESAAVMRSRVAAPDAEGVIAYASAFLEGIARHRVVGCGKHFPGLGGGLCDSHLDTPAIQRTARELLRKDLEPYRQLRDQLPMVMINHAAYPLTPGKTTPASISQYWMQKILRKKLGYRGIVFSDDLEMGGILKHCSIEDAVLTAFRAGIDVVEICRSPELILRAYEALLAEAERSAAFRRILTARSAFLGRQRKKFFASAAPLRPLSQARFTALKSAVLRYSATIEMLQAKQGSAQ